MENTTFVDDDHGVRWEGGGGGGGGVERLDEQEEEGKGYDGRGEEENPGGGSPNPEDHMERPYGSSGGNDPPVPPPMAEEFHRMPVVVGEGLEEAKGCPPLAHNGCWLYKYSNASNEIAIPHVFFTTDLRGPIK